MGAQERDAGRQPLAADGDREHRDRRADRVRAGHENDPRPTSPLADSTRDRREHGAGAGHEDEPETEPEHEAVAVGRRAAARQEQERTLEQPRDARESRLAARTQHGRDRQVAQEILGKSERAQERAPGEREDGERENEPRDDHVRAPAIGAGRAAGEDERQHGQDAGRERGDDAGDERDPEEDQHRRSVRATGLRRSEFALRDVVRLRRMDELLDLDDAERLAEAVVPADAWSYITGGAGDERTLRWNREAFSRFRLRPRVLIDVSSVSTETTVLGSPVSMPVLVAPMAFQAIAHEDGELGDGAGRRGRGDVDVPLHGRDRDSERRCRRGAGRAALAADLRVPRPRGHRTR